MIELPFKCAKCGTELTVDESAAGATASCPQCAASLTIPRQARPRQTPSEDRNINISLGFGGREKRQVQKPSRKLIYALLGFWVAVSIASILGGLVFGYSTGNTSGYRWGQTRGQQAGYQASQNAGYQEGFDAGLRDAIQKTTEGEAAGYAAGKADGYADGRNAALATLRKVNISSGTSAEDVRKYLGTPDSISRYVPPRWARINVEWPCWSYGSVKIYFDGDADYSTVTHWEGDLQSLLDKKLGR